jgi:hypothetical protein
MAILKLIAAFFAWLTSRNTFAATPEGQEQAKASRAEENRKRVDAQVAKAQKAVTSGDEDEVAKTMREHGLLLAIGCLLLTGCGTIEAGWDYCGSYNSAVSIPAKTGACVGSVVGVPAAIVALPVTWPLAARAPADGGAFIVIWPWIFCAMPAAAVFGYLPHVITGD